MLCSDAMYFSAAGIKPEKNKVKVALSAAYLLDTFILFCSSSYIDPSTITKIILIIISICIVSLATKGNKHVIEEYNTRRNNTALLVLAVYSSFASFGYRFFLYGDARPRFVISGLFYCILGSIWFLPVLKTILYLFVSVCSQQKAAMKQTNNVYAFFKLFVFLAACQGIILISFWPGGFPSDCIDQLCQAVGTRVLNDWHPIVHTLFFRIIADVFHSAGMITAIQMMIFVLICTLILMEGFYKGIKLTWLCAGGGLFLLLPNQVFSSILTEKDFLYSLSLWFGTWLVFRLVKTDDKKSFFFYLFFAFDLFLIATTRHNGIISFICTALLCVVLAFKRKNERKIF